MILLLIAILGIQVIGGIHLGVLEAHQEEELLQGLIDIPYCQLSLFFSFLIHLFMLVFPSVLFITRTIIMIITCKFFQCFGLLLYSYLKSAL